MNSFADCFKVCQQGVMNRLKLVGGLADPERESGMINIHALSGIDL
jgi:hypothetical protein